MDWIKWDGLDNKFIDQENEHTMLNPLNNATALVNLRFRDGDVLDAVPAGDFGWEHTGAVSDIIAYQVVKPRPHADLIRAWAYGAIVDRYNKVSMAWVIDDKPEWLDDDIYRLHESQPIIVESFAQIEYSEAFGWDAELDSTNPNVKFIFTDGKLTGVDIV